MQFIATNGAMVGVDKVTSSTGELIHIGAALQNIRTCIELDMKSATMLADMIYDLAGANDPANYPPENREAA